MLFLLFLLRGLFSDLKFFKDFQLYENPYKIKKLKSFWPSTKPHRSKALKHQTNDVVLNEINNSEKSSLPSLQRRR